MRQISNSRLLQTASAFLASTLLLSAFPLSAFASSNAKKSESQDDFGSNTNSIIPDYTVSTAPFTKVTSEKISAYNIPMGMTLSELTEKGYTERVYGLENDLNSIVLSDKVGNMTLFYYDQPVKYIDEYGFTNDKILSLVEQDDGSYRTRQSDIMTTFSPSISDGIKLERDNQSIRLTPLETEAQAALTSDCMSVAYAVDDTTRYEYTLTPMGFKEDIIVESYTGQTEYSFLLETDGLSLVEEYGTYHLVDEYNTVQAFLGEIILFTADDRNNTFGQMQAQTIEEGQEYLLTVELDENWLSDPDTHYPITVDPTINYSTSGNIEDVSIVSTTTHAGDSGSLYVGRGSSGAALRSLMRFPNLNIRGYSVTKATVSIRELLCEDTVRPVECREFTGNSWSESGTTTWSGVGSSAGGTLYGTYNVCYDEGVKQTDRHRYVYDITALAKKWAAGTSSPAKGLVFRSTDSYETSGDKSYCAFASINRGSNPPMLTVEYTTTTASITLNKSSATLYINDTLPLVATTTPSGSAVSWHSDSPSVADVNSNGLVIAKAVGSTKITATANGVSASCAITVKKGDIVISKSTDSVLIGKTLQLRATTTPAGKTVTWSSSNTNIATVNSSGLVTFKYAGEVKITASASGLTSQTVTLYGIISDGVFKLMNSGSRMYMQMDGLRLFQSSNLSQYDEADYSVEIFRMWRFHYIGSGKYTIRSYANPGLALGDNANTLPENAEAYFITTTNETGTRNVQWYISSDSAGCVFTNVETGRVMATPKGDEKLGTKLIYENSAGTTSNSNRRWYRMSVSSSSIPTGLYLYKYDEATGKTNRFFNDTTRMVLNIGEYECIRAIYRDPNIINQSFRYVTSDNSSDVVIVNRGGGVSALSAGTKTIVVIHDNTGSSISYDVKVNKNAIIIIPGIMGSILVTKDDTTSNYPKGTIVWDKTLLDMDITEAIKRVMTLKCNDDGSSENSIEAYNNKYGAGDTYKDLYESLNKEYGSQYDICFFAYDWRLSNKTSASKLDDFISENNYDKVEIVAHSMGGLVASSYLSMGSSQRSKVENLITLGSPLLGVPVVPYIWGSENLNYGGMMNGLPDWGLKLYNVIVKYFNPIDGLIGNFASMYEMFPTEMYFSSKFGNNNYLITLSSGERQEITTYSETTEWIKKYLSAYNNALAEKAKQFHTSLYSSGEHVTSLVNTYYIAGYSNDTVYKVLHNKKTWTVDSYTSDGDGTVPTWSATLGDRYSNKTYFVDGVTHVNLASDSELITFVNNLIAGKTSVSGFKHISAERS